VVERARVLAKWTRWQELLIPKTRNAVDADDVEVPCQTMMLKAVIQDKNLGIVGRYRMMSDQATVTPNQDWNARSMRGQDETLVPGKRHTRMQSISVRNERDHSSTATLVASAREHDAPTSRI
jgi:hypothetical protein